MTTRLESEVWALDNCAGCGLCVAACSKQVLKWNGSDHPILEQRSKAVGYTKETLDSCSFCQKFCEEA
jgi:ferredoxin